MVDALEKGEVKRWLIIAPKRAGLTTWPQEFEKWDFLEPYSLQSIIGLTPAKRKKAYPTLSNHQFTVVNIDLLPILVREANWIWDGVCVDEASKFKESKTSRWKALKHVRSKIKRSIHLTGSPVAQNYESLWAQVWLIDEGKRLGRTFYGYRNTFFYQADYHGFTYRLRAGAEKRILRLVGDVTHVRRAADHLDLPPITVNQLPINLDLKILNQYRKLEKEFFLNLADDGTPITAANAAVLTNKLAQFANGLVYQENEEGVKEVKEIHKYKVEALKDFAEEHGEPFLLAYNYKHDRDRLLYELGDQIEIYTGDRTQLLRWGVEFQILALHPGSAGHGVDGLQHTTNTVVWYGPPWSRELFDQTNGRVTGARQVGTKFEKVPAMIHVMSSRGTIDDSAFNTLEVRGDRQDKFIAALKERAERIYQISLRSS